MKKNALDSTAVGDLKMIKNYSVGILAFGTAVTAFLTQALHFPLEPTLATTVVVGILFLAVVFLIWRAENRMEMKLIDHIDESNSIMQEFRDDLSYLKRMSLECQRSGIRTEMDNEIFRNPSNHDTIIKYAYRYFQELDSDWVETEKFLTWVDNENRAGRPVHLPPDLLANVDNKKAQEKI